MQINNYKSDARNVIVAITKSTKPEQFEELRKKILALN